MKANRHCLGIALLVALSSGCGDSGVDQDATTLKTQARLILDPSGIEESRWDLIRRSNYTGDIFVAVYHRWPPVGEGITSNYRLAFIVDPINLSDLAQGIVVEAGGLQYGWNWIIGGFTPARTAADKGRHLTLGDAHDQLTSTGICSGDCPKGEIECSATCVDYEPGRGVPYIYVKDGETPPPVVIRINKAITDLTTEGV